MKKVRIFSHRNWLSHKHMKFFERLNKLRSDYADHYMRSAQKKDILTIIYEICWLMIKSGYWPQNYIKFNGFLMGVEKEYILRYVPGRLFDSIRNDILNSPIETQLMENKYKFNKILSSKNVSNTRILGRYCQSNGFLDQTGDQSSLKTLLSDSLSDFVIKPTYNSAQGDGVFVFTRSKNKHKPYLLGGIGYDDDAITSFLKNRLTDTNPDWLIEQKINQHGILESIYAHSLNTVRIDTLITVDSNVSINGAVLRVGRSGRTVDNWSGRVGGIGIGINLDDGHLNDVGYDYFMNKYTEHPDTHVQFSEITLPHWEGVLEVVSRASRAFPLVRSVGWDVALTESGPIIVEGNPDYSLQFSQVGCGPYLNNREFVRELRRYFTLCSRWKKYDRYFVR